ncbi:MAG TPA: hypothetical protein DGK99_03375, partial [Acidimicrobiaceae bacterium]|nr:hypothetical protein [Acidimicrobiaceae bacterium]
MEGPTEGEVVASSRPSVAWGLGHVAVGWVVGLIATVAALGVVVAIAGDETAKDPSLAVGALIQGALYVGLVGVPAWLVMVRGVRWADFGWA